jgi:integrase
METQHKATHEEDKRKLRWLQQYFRGKELGSITRDIVAEIGRIKAQASSPPTANRYLALIRAILRKAANEWEWIDRAPKVTLYREAKRRVRWITPVQAQALLSELPLHLREMAMFALATGLRETNLVELAWSQVDLERGTAWIYGDKAKGREDIHVSLSDVAIAVLRRQLGKHPDRVFTYRNKPVGWANTRAWQKALKRAGLKDFRWHDLRHTWASWHVQNGTPLYDLQEMGGWKSEKMVRRYAHLAPANLAKHAQVVGRLLEGTNLAQPSNEKEATLNVTS